MLPRSYAPADTGTLGSDASPTEAALYLWRKYAPGDIAGLLPIQGGAIAMPAPSTRAASFAQEYSAWDEPARASMVADIAALAAHVNMNGYGASDGNRTGVAYVPGEVFFAYDPAQQRGPNGEWTDEGKAAQKKATSASKKAQKQADKASKGAGKGKGGKKAAPFDAKAWLDKQIGPRWGKPESGLSLNYIQDALSEAWSDAKGSVQMGDVNDAIAEWVKAKHGAGMSSTGPVEKQATAGEALEKASKAKGTAQKLSDAALKAAQQVSLKMGIANKPAGKPTDLAPGNGVQSVATVVAAPEIAPKHSGDDPRIEALGLKPWEKKIYQKSLASGGGTTQEYLALSRLYSQGMAMATGLRDKGILNSHYIGYITTMGEVAADVAEKEYSNSPLSLNERTAHASALYRVLMANFDAISDYAEAAPYGWVKAASYGWLKGGLPATPSPAPSPSPSPSTPKQGSYAYSEKDLVPAITWLEKNYGSTWKDQTLGSLVKPLLAAAKEAGASLSPNDAHQLAMSWLNSKKKQENAKDGPLVNGTPLKWYQDAAKATASEFENATAHIAELQAKHDNDGAEDAKKYLPSLQAKASKAAAELAIATNKAPADMMALMLEKMHDIVAMPRTDAMQEKYAATEATIKSISFIHGIDYPALPDWTDYDEGEQMTLPAFVDAYGKITDAARYDVQADTFQSYDEREGGKTEADLIERYKPFTDALEGDNKWEVREATSSYMGSGYGPINNSLRDGTEPEHFDEEQAISDFDPSDAEEQFDANEEQGVRDAFREETDYPTAYPDPDDFNAPDGEPDDERYNAALKAWQDEHQEMEDIKVQSAKDEYVQNAQDEYVSQAQQEFDDNNGYGGSLEEIEGMRDTLDGMFEMPTAVAPDNILAWRSGYLQYATGATPILADLQVGEVVEDKGFVSASIERGVADRFSGQIFQIEIPKGSKAVYLDALHDDSEQEMLLPRGAQFVYMGHVPEPDQPADYDSGVPRLRYVGTDYDPDNPQTLGSTPAEDATTYTEPDAQGTIWDAYDVSMAPGSYITGKQAPGMLEWQKKAKNKPTVPFNSVSVTVTPSSTNHVNMKGAGKLDENGHDPSRFSWQPGDLVSTGKQVDLPAPPDKQENGLPPRLPQDEPGSSERPVYPPAGITNPFHNSRPAEWLSIAAFAYNPSEARDAHGEWTGDGAAVGTAPAPSHDQIEDVLRAHGLEPPRTLDADTVLGERAGAQAGSNSGGFWRGSDGVERYVKDYEDATQGHGEVIANAIYNALGISAPHSGMFKGHDGQERYASEVVPGSTLSDQLGHRGLTQPRADKLLDGYAADVLLANWDVLGAGFDNVIETGGKLHRVDNGSALLHRAQGARKPARTLDELSEWESLAPGGRNDNYAEVFDTAGYAGPDDPAMKGRVQKQIGDIRGLREQLGSGGWDSFVKHVDPTFRGPDRDAIVDLLEHRTRKLVDEHGGQGAANFSYMPTERRDWHGRWVKAGMESAAPPKAAVSEAPGEAAAHVDMKGASPGGTSVRSAEVAWAAMSAAQQMAIVSGVSDWDKAAKYPLINWYKAAGVANGNVGTGTFVGDAADHDKSPAEYSKELMSHMKELTSKAKVVKRTHLDTLRSILSDGRIHSQFVTGKSSGMLDNDTRAYTEAELFYGSKAVPETERPIYGYLTDDPEAPDSDGSQMGLSMYGDADIVLKDSVRQRTTFVMTDSLGVPERGGMLGQGAAPDIFPAPLDNPNLLAYSQQADGLEATKHIQKPPDEEPYTEAQIHGGVQVSDIDHVVLPTYSSGALGDIKKVLDAAHIKYVTRRKRQIAYSAMRLVASGQPSITRFAFDPSQLRGAHGEWADEGRGRQQAGPQGRKSGLSLQDPVEDQIVRLAADNKASMFDIAGVRQQAEQRGFTDLVAHIDAEEANPDRKADWFHKIAGLADEVDAMRGISQDAEDSANKRVNINLGVTPYRGKPIEQVQGVEGYYQSTRYKGWLTDLRVEAGRYDVAIKDVTKVAGVWQGHNEPSASVWVNGRYEDIRSLAGSIGGEYNQEGVMMFSTDQDDGTGALYTFPGVSDAEKAVRAMSDVGIDGGRIEKMRDGKFSLEVIDMDGSQYEQVKKLRGVLGTEILATPGKAELLFGGTDYERRSHPHVGRGSTYENSLPNAVDNRREVV